MRWRDTTPISATLTDLIRCQCRSPSRHGVPASVRARRLGRAGRLLSSATGRQASAQVHRTGLPASAWVLRSFSQLSRSSRRRSKAACRPSRSRRAWSLRRLCRAVRCRSFSSRPRGRLSSPRLLSSGRPDRPTSTASCRSGSLRASGAMKLGCSRASSGRSSGWPGSGLSTMSTWLIWLTNSSRAWR